MSAAAQLNADRQRPDVFAQRRPHAGCVDTERDDGRDDDGCDQTDDRRIFDLRNTGLIVPEILKPYGAALPALDKQGFGRLSTFATGKGKPNGIFP